MKKFLCAILFLTMVISLSACGGKGVSTLVKHMARKRSMKWKSSVPMKLSEKSQMTS